MINGKRPTVKSRPSFAVSRSPFTVPMRQIIDTQDGSHSILSEEFGVSYHSKYGAIQESMHVFIEAGLHPRMHETQQLDVLGIGFGTGLNALLTCIEADKQQVKIDYTAVEAYPLSLEIISQLNYTTELQLTSQDNFFDKIHDATWENRVAIHPYFSIEKNNMRFEEIDAENAFDVIFFDAFAPNSQPELWEAPMFQKMYKALRSNGILTTYCAKGVVKRTLKSVGFTIEALPGPPGKREMTRALKMPKSKSQAPNSK